MAAAAAAAAVDAAALHVTLSGPAFAKLARAMPKGVKKSDLPSKVCVVCGLPFTWRKKWERCWDEVTTCSQRCNNERKRLKRKQSDTNGESDDSS
eukprot:jgi/Chlat1/2734/Chrsp182S02891